MKKLLFPLLLFSFSLSAQHLIEPERLSELQSASVLDKNNLQVEIGFVKEKEKDGDYLLQQPKVTLRYGIAKPFELRLNVVNESQYLPNKTLVRDGFRPIEPGVKFLMLQSRDTGMQLSLQAHAGLHVISSGKHDPGKAYHKIRLLFLGELNHHWHVNLNVGTDWDSKEQKQNYVYGVGSEMELSSKIRSVIEFVGHFSKEHSPKSLISAGLGYGLTSDLMVDLNGGLGLNSQSPEYTFGIGPLIPPPVNFQLNRKYAKTPGNAKKTS